MSTPTGKTKSALRKNVEGQRSAPTLGFGKWAQSPLLQSQLLCTGSIKGKCFIREVVEKGVVRTIPERKMHFMTCERTVTPDSLHPPKKTPHLPPLSEVLRSIEDMDLEPMSDQQFRRSRQRRVAFGGSGRSRLGPTLPLRRGRVHSLPRLGSPTCEWSPEPSSARSISSSNGPLNSPPVSGSRRGAFCRGSIAVPYSSGGSVDQSPKGGPFHSPTSVGTPPNRPGSKRQSMAAPRGSSPNVPGPRGSSPNAAIQMQNSWSGSFMMEGEATFATIDSAPEATPEVVELSEEEKLRRVDEVEVPFKWSEEEIRSVFAKYDNDFDGEIHRDDVPAMLNYLGTRKSPDDAMRIVDIQTRFATLNYDEFVEFLHKYREWDVAKLREEFKNADKDHGGDLDFTELHSLLQEMGYAPTLQGTMEAMEYIDVDGDMRIDLLEFDNLREYLRKTEGMTKEAIADLKELFEKATKGTEGSSRDAASEEVWRLTSLMGYSCTVQDIRNITKEVEDADNYEELIFPELMKVMRLVREQEKDRIVDIFKVYGTDTDTLPIEYLALGLADLGYYPSEDAIYELLDHMSETMAEEDFLNLEEFSAFMEKYRAVDGFSEAERESLAKAFDEHRVQGKDTLRTLDAGRVLRWFGFSRTVQQVQHLVRWVDLERTGDLTVHGFTKLMRRMYQDEAKLRYKLFDLYRNAATDELPLIHVPRVLHSLQGVPPSFIFIEKALEEIGIKVSLNDSRRNSTMSATMSMVPSTNFPFENLNATSSSFTPPRKSSLLATIISRQMSLTGTLRAASPGSSPPGSPLAARPGTAPLAALAEKSSLNATAAPAAGTIVLGAPKEASGKSEAAAPADAAAVAEAAATEGLGVTEQLDSSAAASSEIAPNTEEAAALAEVMEDTRTTRDPAPQAAAAKSKTAEGGDEDELKGTATATVQFPGGDTAASTSPLQSLEIEGVAPKSANEVYLTRPQFEAFYKHFRQFLLTEIHTNAGYTKAEVANLRASFESYDKDKSGTVERSELAKMLAEYFPDSTKSKAGQQDIVMALHEVDKDGNGELDFDEYLNLMRKCDDARDARDLELELEIVRECQFQPEEVEGFRQIFSEHVDWKGELLVDTILDILAKVLELTEEREIALTEMVRKLHPEGREVARFPQFLRLIRQLVVEDYAGVNSLAARMVKRDEAIREQEIRQAQANQHSHFHSRRESKT